MQFFLLAILAYVPFQVALNVAPGFDVLSIRVLVSMLFAWWLARGLLRRSVYMQMNLPTAFLLLFLALAAASLLVADNLGFGARKLLFWLSIFPLYFVAADLLRDAATRLRAARVLLWSGLAAAVVGFVQFASQFWVGASTLMQWWIAHVGPVFWGRTVAQTVGEYQSLLVNLGGPGIEQGGETVMRLVSLFPDPHMAAFYFGMLAPLSLVLVSDTKQKTTARVGYGVIGAVLLVATLLTFSRGAYLALLVASVVGAIIAWPHARDGIRMHMSRRKPIHLTAPRRAVIGVVATTGVLLAFAPGNPVSDRLYSSFDILDNSVAERAAIWQQAIDVIHDRPLLGTGLGNYSYYLEPAAGYRTPIYAHSTYLDVTAETGLLNGVVWIALVLTTIVIGIVASMQSAAALGPTMSIMIFATYSVVETALFSPRVLPILIIIIVLTSRAAKSQDRKTRPTPKD